MLNQRWRLCQGALLWTLVWGGASGQTAVRLSTQVVKDKVDFTNATQTKPVRTGATLPSACEVGEAYWKTDATAGQNLYLCSSANVWTKAVFSMEAGSGVVTAGAVVSVDETTVPSYSTGDGAPAGSCVVGRDYYVNTTTKQLYYCPETDVWSLIASSGAGLGDPGANGIVKRTALNTTAAATAGSDYYAPGTVIASADLPSPTTTAGGKVKAMTCANGYFVSVIGDNGDVTCAQPASSAGGTVMSVGLSLPSEFSVSGTPVTTSGTLTGAWTSQSANRVLASPSGSSGVPSFRTLAATDLSDTSELVRGAAGLVTAGYLARVSASGTVGPTTRLYEDSSGNTGIGTTSPGYRFDVNGSARIYDQTATTGATRFYVTKGAADTASSNVLVTDASASFYGLTLTGTGGSGHFLKQGSAGGAITSGVPAASDLSNGVSGTGAVVLAASPTIVTPAIASFANAVHTHQDAAGGGTLDAAAIGSGTMAPARLGTGVASASTYLRGDGTWATPSGSSALLTMYMFGGAAALSSSSTIYGPAPYTNSMNGTESVRTIMFARAATITTLYVYAINSSAITCDATVTLRVNGVDTSSTLTIPATSTTGSRTISTTSLSQPLAAGDLLSLKWANGACAGPTIYNVTLAGIYQ